jgi:two-component sensor histidine kinase
MDQASIGETLITDQLDRRTPRPPDAEREIAAYCALAEKIVGSADDVLSEIAPLALDLCDAGSAGIALLESDTEGAPLIRWHAVAGALAAQQGLALPQDQSPCGLCAAERKPLLFVRPQRAFAAFEAMKPPVEELLVVPLRERGERSRGTLWIACHDAARKFDPTDLLVLLRLGHFTALALHIRDELKQRDTLVQEMNHRVKNSLQLVTSLLSLQSRRLAAPLQAELQMASRRIQSIARVHDLLHQGQAYETVALRPYLGALCHELARLQPDDGDSRIDLDLVEVDLPTSQTIALGIIVTELVLNALTHGARKGQGAQVRVRLTRSEDEVLHLAVEDDGVGLAPDFDPAASTGVGMQLVRAMTAQLHGALRPVLATKGTRFEVSFPYRGR